MRVMEQKAPRSVSWRFTPKNCDAREGVCRVGVSCRRFRHCPMTFSRHVRVAVGALLRFYQRGPIACGIDDILLVEII